MGRGRHAGYDDQREAILAQAARLFADRGYAGTSMAMVAEACGLSKATLYHYWPDKDALLFAIADGHVQRLQALVAQTPDPHAAPRERLAALIAQLVQHYAGAQDAHRVLTAEVRFLPPALRERMLAREREVVAAFADAVAAVRPELREAALAKPLTMLLFGMVNWMHTWLRPDGAYDHAALAPVVAELFLGGLGAVTGPAPTVRAGPAAVAPAQQPDVPG
jgi:AcrR family transcriptional regulator